MDVKDIPQELIELLDDRAGKQHSNDGPVLKTLAEIITKYEELRNKSHTYQCNLCGNTTFTFDPPVKITQEFTICGATKPGNWPMQQFLKTCILEKGHLGKHYSVLEIEDSWEEVT